MPSLHRLADDGDPQHYPLKRIVIELQAPASASLTDMLADLDDIATQLRSGETAFAAEALFGYRVRVEQAEADMFTGCTARDSIHPPRSSS